MSKSAVKKNSHPQFSLLSCLARIILYGSVFSSVFWPSYLAFESTYYYHWQCRRTKTEFYSIFDAYNSCNWGGETPSTYRYWIARLNKAQQAYYLENHRFADSIKEAGVGFKLESYNYNYRIVQEMVPVQDLNQSLSPDSDLPMTMAIAHHKTKDNSQNPFWIKNHLGVVYTFPETSEFGESEIITGAIACEMRFKKPLPTTMPTMKDGIMQCPNGTKKLREEEL